MTVDMIARTLADEWCNASPEEIRSAMLGSEMEEDDYPEIDTDHDGDPEQRKIYGHLRALFQLQNLKKEEEQALRCAALLPPEGMQQPALPAGFARRVPGFHPGSAPARLGPERKQAPDHPSRGAPGLPPGAEAHGGKLP